MQDLAVLSHHHRATYHITSNHLSLPSYKLKKTRTALLVQELFICVCVCCSLELYTLYHRKHLVHCGITQTSASCIAYVGGPGTRRKARLRFADCVQIFFLTGVAIRLRCFVHKHAMKQRANYVRNMWIFFISLN